MTRTKVARACALVLPLTCVVLVSATSLPRWGRAGHEIAGLAAATSLPSEMPEFFRAAERQLGWLNYEPDRWREGRFREMDQGFQYDHYIDGEIIPTEALAAGDRFTYLGILQRAGLSQPARDAGILPFRILELQGRLTTAFKRWREEQDPVVRAWIEQRIINDAGVLGHYVADAANPHHTTVHFNGWADGWHNPNGYTTDRTFHGRFEGEFVGANVRIEDVRPHVGEARFLDDVREEVFAHIERAHRELERLYQLEQQERFSRTTTSPAHKAFAVERLADGARMLGSLWWTAWVRSGDS